MTEYIWTSFVLNVLSIVIYLSAFARNDWPVVTERGPGMNVALLLTATAFAIWAARLLGVL